MKSSNNLNQPPFSHGNPEFTFPEFKKYTLPGKLKIYFLEDNKYPVVSFKLLSHAGAFSESMPGVGNFTMGMLQNGTSSRSASEIYLEIDSIGAVMGSAANWDESLLSFSCLANKFDAMFDILLDCYYNPAFDSTEIERQRKKLISNIQSNLAEPDYLASIGFNRKFFKDHPYAHPRIGHIETIKSIEREDIVDFYENRFLASPPVLIVAGNIDEEYVINKIEKAFTSFSSSIDEYIPDVEKLTFHNFSPGTIIIPKPGAKQSSIRIGNLAINRHHEDYAAFQVANTIYGGYFLSRLNSYLREEKGYTYGVGSYIDPRKFATIYAVATNVNTSNTATAVSDIKKISREFSSSEIGATEISRAVQYLLGSFSRVVETSRQISSLITNMETHSLDDDYFTKFFNKVASITVDEVNSAAAKYFTAREQVLAISGDSDELVNQMSAYEPIDLYNP